MGSKAADKRTARTNAYAPRGSQESDSGEYSKQSLIVETWD
jgi:hypothetical protein